MPQQRRFPEYASGFKKSPTIKGAGNDRKFASGSMDNNIAIRTLVYQIFCWVGGGIVADSRDPAYVQFSSLRAKNCIRKRSLPG